MTDNEISVVKKFLELRYTCLEKEDLHSFIFLRHIWAYFYDTRNYPNTSNSLVFSIFIPGKYDLVKSDNLLFELGYRRYSIDYLPKGQVYKCETTKVTFRNTLL